MPKPFFGLTFVLRLVVLTATVLSASVSFAQCKDFTGNYKSVAAGGKEIILNYRQTGCSSITTESSDRRRSPANPLTVPLDGTLKYVVDAYDVTINGKNKTVDASVSAYINDKEQLVTIFHLFGVNPKEEFTGRFIDEIDSQGQLIRRMFIDGVADTATQVFKRIN